MYHISTHGDSECVINNVADGCIESGGQHRHRNR